MTLYTKRQMQSIVVGWDRNVVLPTRHKPILIIAIPAHMLDTPNTPVACITYAQLNSQNVRMYGLEFTS